MFPPRSLVSRLCGKLLLTPSCCCPLPLSAPLAAATQPSENVQTGLQIKADPSPLCVCVVLSRTRHPSCQGCASSPHGVAGRMRCCFSVLRASSWWEDAALVHGCCLQPCCCLPRGAQVRGGPYAPSRPSTALPGALCCSFLYHKCSANQDSL